MSLKTITIYASTAFVSLIIFTFFFLLLYRWKYGYKKIRYPSIVLTSHDSPQLKEKRLWSPPNVKDDVTKSVTKDERNKKARSYWFPKRDIIPFFAPTTREYQQPVACKQVRSSCSTVSNLVKLMNNCILCTF